ncbi:hypothetical protein NVP1293O_24 [Vibrio phage 1.293.O._10N.261.52.E1]|nr:hypothetical protein NVP1293O_24 [Vibrio phage 1.293.O._10N.261.52.E1]
MIRPDHLRKYVIEPSLIRLGSRYKSDDAVELLLMIAAHESHLGEYLHQVGGPAVGIFQMEPATFHDCLVNFVRYNRILENQLGQEFYRLPNPAYMAFDLSFATAMARVQLYRQPEALPHRSDIRAMAEYAKKYWNTEAGKATVDDYEQAYRVLVLGEEIEE